MIYPKAIFYLLKGDYKLRALDQRLLRMWRRGDHSLSGSLKLQEAKGPQEMKWKLLFGVRNLGLAQVQGLGVPALKALQGL